MRIHRSIRSCPSRGRGPRFDGVAIAVLAASPLAVTWCVAPRPRRVNSLPLRVGSHVSSVGAGGLVAVSVPAVSDSGLAPGHLSERWGDFPHGGAGRHRMGTRWHTHGGRALSTRFQFSQPANKPFGDTAG